MKVKYLFLGLVSLVSLSQGAENSSPTEDIFREMCRGWEKLFIENVSGSAKETLMMKFLQCLAEKWVQADTFWTVEKVQEAFAIYMTMQAASQAHKDAPEHISEVSGAFRMVFYSIYYDRSDPTFKFLKNVHKEAAGSWFVLALDTLGDERTRNPDGLIWDDEESVRCNSCTLDKRMQSMIGWMARSIQAEKHQCQDKFRDTLAKLSNAIKNLARCLLDDFRHVLDMDESKATLKALSSSPSDSFFPHSFLPTGMEPEPAEESWSWWFVAPIAIAAVALIACLWYLCRLRNAAAEQLKELDTVNVIAGYASPQVAQ